MVSLTYIKRINKYRAHYFGRKPIFCKCLAVRPSHVLKYMLATLQLMIPSYRLIPKRSVPIYVCHICNNEIMISKVWRTNTSIFLTFELRYSKRMMYGLLLSSPTAAAVAATAAAAAAATASEAAPAAADTVANLAPLSMTSQLLWPLTTTNYGGQSPQRGSL